MMQTEEPERDTAPEEVQRDGRIKRDFRTGYDRDHRTIAA